MSTTVQAKDWQVQGVCQVGVAAGVGAGVYLFQYRSRHANFNGSYLFLGGGFGAGGSLGGAAMPSPAQIAANVSPDLWTSVKCERAFSAEDVDLAYGALSTVSAAGALGYSLLGISAGLVDPLIDSADVSGWGTGVGAVGAILFGVWTRLTTNDSTFH